MDAFRRCHDANTFIYRNIESKIIQGWIVCVKSHVLSNTFYALLIIILKEEERHDTVADACLILFFKKLATHAKHLQPVLNICNAYETLATCLEYLQRI